MNSSVDSFPIPYAPSGVAIVVGVTTSGCSDVAPVNTLSRDLTLLGQTHQGASVHSEGRCEDESDELAGFDALLTCLLQQQAH